MRTRLIWIFVSGLAIAIALELPSVVRAEDSAALSQALTVCNAGFPELDRKIDTTKSSLVDLEKQLASKPPDTPGLQAASAIVEKKTELDRAAALDKEAKVLLDKARSEPNTAEASRLVKDAEDKASGARNIVQRVESGLQAAKESGGLAAMVGGRGLDPLGSAFSQLLRDAQLNKQAMDSPSRETASKLSGQVYDAEQSRRVVDVRPAGSPLFQASADATAWDPSRAQVTVSGRVVDVRSLQVAVRSISRDAQPFERVPSPDAAPVYKLSESARSLLSSPDTRRQLERVGGVELKVTIDLLGYLGLPDFRKTGPSAVVEDPALVSLGALAKLAAVYADGTRRWEDLPDDLRYPGSIERIYGFVLGSGGRDIFLIGARARSLATRIDLDSIIVALRFVWKEDRTPAVSLDPNPADEPGGPQYVRIEGAPATSSFAKTMLDADYAMKRIMLGKLQTSAPGYSSYAALLAAANHLGTGANRFWFYPAPLGPKDVRISGTARSVMFDSGLQVLTESERIVASGFVGTGTADEIATRAAESFTS
jgi:hypothetical protein